MEMNVKQSAQNGTGPRPDASRGYPIRVIASRGASLEGPDRPTFTRIYNPQEPEGLRALAHVLLQSPATVRHSGHIYAHTGKIYM